MKWVIFKINTILCTEHTFLGITTVLTMTFLGLEARKDLPKERVQETYKMIYNVCLEKG